MKGWIEVFSSLGVFGLPIITGNDLLGDEKVMMSVVLVAVIAFTVSFGFSQRSKLSQVRDLSVTRAREAFPAHFFKRYLFVWDIRKHVSLQKDFSQIKYALSPTNPTMFAMLKKNHFVSTSVNFRKDILSRLVFSLELSETNESRSQS